MRRWVLHIDMDAFFASCEQLTRPTLAGRPVLVGGVTGRGVVAGASYEARGYGVHSAMPVYQARQLIGFKAVVVHPRKAVYSAASKRVFQLVRREAGVIEQLSIDEAFMEPECLKGASPDKVRAWADHLRALIAEETGLPSSIGAGSGKQYAKIGSGVAKPAGCCVIPVEKQHQMLDPLPVRKLWGIGPVAEKKLAQLGIETIADFAALSEKEVRLVLGPTVGVGLWKLARGTDDRPVAPKAVAKQISQEHTFGRDLTTLAQVTAAVDRAAHGAFQRLEADGRGARTVTVKIKTTDFKITSRSQTLPYATRDEQTLAALARELIRPPSDTGALRLVGVSYSGLETPRQDVLFPELDRQRTTVSQVSDWETGVRSSRPAAEVSQAGDWGEVEKPESRFRATDDVFHPEFGHGWIQGIGHGVVSVRFETRATGPGPVKSFADDDEKLRLADPLDSLAWQDWLERRDESDES
ncbi:DNA polymerase IV [Corynebacterium mendelii]|uniref:DNA polymerase IV n=1 Tax=Corynebacterium mendelii TaxID=2765362 RepID=A0A939IWK3_9CORY|nr:DNA polymerase IV [Corynebacterium mendelii]MBN9643118.1 DNA polymerase IV [Corynebacterium mendelii]